MLADEVFAWLSGLPDWQRDLARRLSAQVDLLDDEYAEALEMVRHAYGLPATSPPVPRPLQRDHISVGGDVDEERLMALGGLHGIGLVGEHEELTFGENGLTIIYGQNGAGKSTYVRVLKKLCRTVDRDCHVRGSIYDTAAPPPSARFKIKANGALTERRTSLLEAATAAHTTGMSAGHRVHARLAVRVRVAIDRQEDRGSGTRAARVAARR